MHFRNLNKISTEESVNDLIDATGIEVLYLRASNNMKCNCYDELTKTSNDPNCKCCFGKGYVTIIERMKVSRQGLPSIASNQDPIKTDLGTALLDRKIYYFDNKSKPKDNDIVILCNFDVNGNVLEVLHVDTLKDVDGINGFNNKISYYTAISKQRPELVKDYNSMITKLPNEVFKLLRQKRRYICGVIK